MRISLETILSFPANFPSSAPFLKIEISAKRGLKSRQGKADEILPVLSKPRETKQEDWKNR